MAEASFIAVDWGGTSFRAWALDSAGNVIASRQSTDGLKTVADRDFAGTLRRNCNVWLNARPDIRVLMKGMVGARTGWVEAEYLPCPASLPHLAAAATRFDLDGHEIAILPGAMMQDEAGDADVMRGEEVQILGAAGMTGKTEATICIPGTHNKWARLEGGILTGFRTFVTGELFQILLNGSLVGALAAGDATNDDAFRRGLDRGAALPLSHAVFAARASALTGSLPPEDVGSFLSGVLVGSECAARPDGPVLLMASGMLADRYGLALTHFGCSFEIVDAGAASLAGLAAAAALLWPDAVPA